jgi:predicted PurR-regulated permease PerM
MPSTPAPAPVRPISQIPPAELPGLSGLLTLAVAVVVIVALYVGREVMIPITLAVLLSFVLAPLVGILRRVLGRIPSVLLAVTVALGVILALSGVIGMQVAELAADMPRYTDTIRGKLDTVRDLTVGRLSIMMSDIGREITKVIPSPTPIPPVGPAPATARPEPDKTPKPQPVELRQPDLTPVELVERVVAPILAPLSTTGIVFIVATFILLQQEDLRDRMIRLFGSDDLHRTTSAMDEAGRRLSRYFLTQLGLNAGFGCVICLGLLIIGVPNPVLWGILSALLRFVPYFGSFIAALVPVALAAAVDPGWGMAAWTAALFLIAEAMMGQFVEPLVYGHSTGLSPVSVVVAAIFWGWMWGPIGLILSMPLTLCLVVLGRHIKRLEFIDVLLGDRPALTPVESFYQRMLAGDPDEALEYAEVFLKDHSLSAYYDEVALKGLQLAANDASRGVLTPEQLARIIISAVDDLIDALDEHDDADPSPGASPERPSLPVQRAPVDWRVLCVAGRGPLDETVCAMLAQLLGKHGLSARVAPHSTASRTAIATLDAANVAMVCICSLDMAGNPSHLRYLLRRIRQATPGARILVGLEPPDEPETNIERLRAAIGADCYAVSLRQAVRACLEAALTAQAANAPADAIAGRKAISLEVDSPSDEIAG